MRLRLKLPKVRLPEIPFLQRVPPAGQKPSSGRKLSIPAPRSLRPIALFAIFVFLGGSLVLFFQSGGFAPSDALTSPPPVAGINPPEAPPVAPPPVGVAPPSPSAALSEPSAPAEESASLPLPLPVRPEVQGSGTPAASSFRDPFAYPEEKPQTAPHAPPPPVLPSPPQPSPWNELLPPPPTRFLPPSEPSGKGGKESKAEPSYPPPPLPLGVVYAPEGEAEILLLSDGRGGAVEVFLGQDTWGGYRYLKDGRGIVARPLSPKGQAFRLRPLPGGGYAWVAEKGGGL